MDCIATHVYVAPLNEDGNISWPHFKMMVDSAVNGKLKKHGISPQTHDVQQGLIMFYDKHTKETQFQIKILYTPIPVKG